MTMLNSEAEPSKWILTNCDHCSRDLRRELPTEPYPDDWLVVWMTIHPAMRRPGGPRLHVVVLCPDCNPYRLLPDGSPAN